MSATRPAEDVDSKNSIMNGLFISLVSCQGKSKFCEEQVQDQETSSNLEY